MRNQPTSVPGQQEVSPVSPVITGRAWLGDDDPDQSLTLQLRLSRRWPSPRWSAAKACPAPSLGR